MLKRTKFLVGFILFIAIGISSCGDNSVDVSFNITFENTTVQTWAMTGTTARVWYRYKQLGDNVKFQPAQALPAVEAIGTDGQTRFEFSTASKAGFTVTSGGNIFLKNFPIGKEETEMGLEFLKTMSDGGIYVVAYGVYRGPATALSESQLKADAVTGLTIYAGRSCGRCASQEAIAANAAEGLYKERCGSNVNPLRSCAWAN